ncbi:MAG TPA: hypothetical protein QGI62_06050 [Anaerolineales bacterium]|nr:hypothetical protein [Anaerolineales bacterium]
MPFRHTAAQGETAPPTACTASHFFERRKGEFPEVDPMAALVYNAGQRTATSGPYAAIANSLWINS